MLSRPKRHTVEKYEYNSKLRYIHNTTNKKLLNSVNNRRFVYVYFLIMHRFFRPTMQTQTLPYFVLVVGEIYFSVPIGGLTSL